MDRRAGAGTGLRALIAASALVAALAVAPAAGASSLPFLSRPEGEGIAKLALSHVRDFWWDGRAGGTVRCTRRVNRSHLRCRAEWAVGDGLLYGSVRAWFSRRASGVWSNYAYSITVLDDYCYSVQHRPYSRCARRRSASKLAYLTCGTIPVGDHPARVSITQGRTSCDSARWILAWFFDRNTVGPIPGWWECHFDHGHNLEHGGLGYCGLRVRGRWAAVVQASAA